MFTLPQAFFTVKQSRRVYNGIVIMVIYSGADKRPLPSNAPPKQPATLKQKRSLQAL